MLLEFLPDLFGFADFIIVCDNTDVPMATGWVREFDELRGLRNRLLVLRLTLQNLLN